MSFPGDMAGRNQISPFDAEMGHSALVWTSPSSKPSISGLYQVWSPFLSPGSRSVFPLAEKKVWILPTPCVPFRTEAFNQSFFILPFLELTGTELLLGADIQEGGLRERQL